MGLRYPVKQNLPFYVFVIAYVYLMGRMTFNIWFADINVFATYVAVDPSDVEALIMQANKVYWSKNAFLFTTVILFTLRMDYRAALGLGAFVWSLALMLAFSPSPTLLAACALGLTMAVYHFLSGTRAS